MDLILWIFICGGLLILLAIVDFFMASKNQRYSSFLFGTVALGFMAAFAKMVIVGIT